MLIVRQRGEIVPVGRVPHHRIAFLVLQLVSDGTYCREHDCGVENDLIYSPIDDQPVFTSETGFPSVVGETPNSSGTDAVREGMASHAVRLAAYRQLLRRAMCRP